MSWDWHEIPAIKTIIISLLVAASDLVVALSVQSVIHVLSKELQGLVKFFPLSLFAVPHLFGGKVVLGNSRRHFKWVIQMYGERFRHLNYNLI